METEHKLNRNLFKLALPILIELLFINLIGAMDTLMLTGYDDKKVASVGNANTTLNFIFVLLTIAGVGINIVVSQYLGAKKPEEAQKAFRVGIIFNLALGIILCITLELFGKQLFYLIGTPADILDSAVSYLKIVAMALPFIAITNALSANLRANGKPQYIMLTAILVNLVNISLNYLLIFGNLGMPELGSNGAAIATLVCHILSFSCGIIATRVVLKTKIVSKYISLTNLKIILRVGLPSALETVCYNIMALISMSAVNRLLTDAVTTRALVYLMLGFIMQFSIGFGSANQILVGYAIGEGDYKLARKTTYLSFLVAYPIVVFLCIITITLSPFAFPYLITNNNVIAMMKTVLPVIIFLETGRCINIIFINALKASGDVIFPLEAALFSMFLFGAFGSYFFGIFLELGIQGIFIAYALDECFRGILMLWRFKGTKWEKYSVLKSSRKKKIKESLGLV